jgi:uncharacterized protein DUF3394
LLLIAFTLFNPGYWLNKIADPYDNIAPTEANAIADAAPDDGVLRVVLTGEDFATGKVTTTTVELPLGLKSDGDGAARLDKTSGIAFATDEENKVLVDNVAFGQFAQEKGVDFDWEVVTIEQPADRIAKEWFYIPALALLALIIMLQLGRARKTETVKAGKVA